MKAYKVFFFDIRLKIDRTLIEYSTSIKNCENEFNFKNPDYLIINIIEL